MNLNKLAQKIIKKLNLSDAQYLEVKNGVDKELKRINGMSKEELQKELDKYQGKNGNND